MRVTAPEWISQDTICESHSGQAMYLALSLFFSLLHPSNIHPFQEVSREGSSFSLRASLGEGPRDSFKESLAAGLAFFSEVLLPLENIPNKIRLILDHEY